MPKKMTKFNNWHFSQNIVNNQNLSIMHIPFICTNSSVVFQTEMVPSWKPPTRHFNHFNNRIFPRENPIKNLWITNREILRLAPLPLKHKHNVIVRNKNSNFLTK